jgi:hypothetical protein
MSMPWLVLSSSSMAPATLACIGDPSSSAPSSSTSALKESSQGCPVPCHRSFLPGSCSLATATNSSPLSRPGLRWRSLENYEAHMVLPEPSPWMRVPELFPTRPRSGRRRSHNYDKPLHLPWESMRDSSEPPILPHLPISPVLSLAAG